MVTIDCRVWSVLRKHARIKWARELHVEFHLLCEEGSWWMKWTESGCVGCRHQRARGGFNSTHSCSSLGSCSSPQSAANHHASFHSITNLHLCSEGTKTHKHFLDHIPVCFIPGGLIEALEQQQVTTGPLQPSWHFIHSSHTHSTSCNTHLSSPKSCNYYWGMQMLKGWLPTGDEEFFDFLFGSKLVSDQINLYW